MFDFSPIQIIIVLGIALLVFGPKRLPDLGRSLGNGIRDFRGALTGDGHDHDATHLTGPAVETAEPTTEQIIAEAGSRRPPTSPPWPPPQASPPASPRSGPGHRHGHIRPTRAAPRAARRAPERPRAPHGAAHPPDRERPRPRHRLRRDVRGARPAARHPHVAAAGRRRTSSSPCRPPSPSSRAEGRRSGPPSWCRCPSGSTRSTRSSSRRWPTSRAGSRSRSSRPVGPVHGRRRLRLLRGPAGRPELPGRLRRGQLQQPAPRRRLLLASPPACCWRAA